MNQFYIERLVISGIGHEPSSIEFTEGLNFVTGPSNTGKSHVMSCIDYLFGFSETAARPFKFNANWGYDTFTMVLKTIRGSVIMTRKLGEKKIQVSGTDQAIQEGTYSVSKSAKNSINGVWLKLLGISADHQIAADRKGKTQALTWRGIKHLCYIAQEHIASEHSAFLNTTASIYNMTPSQAALLFLLTGQDATKIDKGEDKQTKVTRKKAVMDYIEGSISRLAKRIEALDGIIATEQIPNIDAETERVTAELDTIRRKMNDAVSRSKSLMTQIYDANGKISEYNAILKSLDALRIQYEADVDRLAFVIDGEQIQADFAAPTKCPFCNADMKHEEAVSYVDSARAELIHIGAHIRELQMSIDDTVARKNRLQITVDSLEEQRRSIDEEIRNVLSPRIMELQQCLETYRKTVQYAKELETLKEEKIGYEADLLQWQLSSVESNQESKDIRDDYGLNLIRKLNQKVSDILREIHFPGYASVHLNMDTFDFSIDGVPKGSVMGGGFTGILNAVSLQALREVLHEEGKHEIGVLYLDSVFTQLSEPEYLGKAQTIKESFLRYLLAHQSIGQTIIIEQREKLPDWLVESKDCHVEVFTKSKEQGRYGLLKEVFED